MSSEPTPTRAPTRLRRLAPELPLVAGVLLGWVGAWWRGKAFVLDGLPHGYGWFDYLNNAWMIVHRTQLGYNNFREPLHAWMVGSLGGAVGSYPDAAALIASTGVFLLVVAGACFGRGLAGPWTGALCAAAIPWTAHAADMARWANYYGVAGSFAGACLGLGALAYRWPHPLWAGLAGLMGGLAWGTDPRSMTLAAGGVGLVLLGLTRFGGAQGSGLSWTGRLASVGLLAAGLYLGPWSHDTLWLTEVADPTWQHRVDFQRKVIERWISKTPDLAGLCQGYRNLETRAVLEGPCGQALAAHNLDIVLPRHLPFGLWPTLAGLGLMLLPARQGWRGTLAGLSLLGGLVGLGLLVGTMPVPDRYVVTFVPLLTWAAPVGLGRLARTVLPTRLAWLGAGVVVLGLGLWSWQADPAARTASTQLTRSPRRALERQAIQEVRRRLGEADQYRDCTQLLVAAALLPRLTQPDPPVLRIESNEQCGAWIALGAPEGGTRWVSIDRSTQLPDQEGARINDAILDLGAMLDGDPAWSRELTLESFELWKRTTP